MVNMANISNTDAHVVHCSISAPQWRSFRSILAMRGETVRASLERWVQHVVAEAAVVAATIEPANPEDHTFAEAPVTSDERDEPTEVVT
jgi:hypothetical protein